MYNVITPFYEPANRLPTVASADVLGGRFVDIDTATAGRQAGGSPGLASNANGGNYIVKHATAGGLALGVAQHDAKSGTRVTVLSGDTMVLPVMTSAAIAVGLEVEVGANGTVVPLASGKAVGRNMATAANGTYAEIKLYK